VPARVAELDIGVEWEPNVPDGVLVSGGLGPTVLALNAHVDDPDQRAVVLRWDFCVAVIHGPYNDEARHRHPLVEAGLRDVQWIGEVSDSQWLQAIRPAIAASVADILRHFVVLTKERTIELAARDLEVLRFAGSTQNAALAARAERA
jgi:hypothetical protein